jgi:hypothetical protein
MRSRSRAKSEYGRDRVVRLELAQRGPHLVRVCTQKERSHAWRLLLYEQSYLDLLRCG